MNGTKIDPTDVEACDSVEVHSWVAVSFDSRDKIFIGEPLNATRGPSSSSRESFSGLIFAV